MPGQRCPNGRVRCVADWADPGGSFRAVLVRVGGVSFFPFHFCENRVSFFVDRIGRQAGEEIMLDRRERSQDYAFEIDS